MTQGPEDDLTIEEQDALLSRDWEKWGDDTYETDPLFTINDAEDYIEGQEI